MKYSEPFLRVRCEKILELSRSLPIIGECLKGGRGTGRTWEGAKDKPRPLLWDPGLASPKTGQASFPCGLSPPPRLVLLPCPSLHSSSLFLSLQISTFLYLLSCYVLFYSHFFFSFFIFCLSLLLTFLSDLLPFAFSFRFSFTFPPSPALHFHFL